MRYVLIAAAVLGALAACSPREAPPSAPAHDAGAAAETPEAFVRSLYDAGHGRDGLVGDAGERRIWSMRTQILVAESERLTPRDYVGFFEADPVCDCQDGTPVLQSVIATSRGPDRADVAVVQGFAEPGNAVHRKTYNLVREGGQWRIDDQHYESMGQFPYEPMVQRLQAWIAEAREPGAWG
jgi:hypothetical protein